MRKNLFTIGTEVAIEAGFEKMLDLNSKIMVVHSKQGYITILAHNNGIILISYKDAFYFYAVATGVHTYIEEVADGKLKQSSIPWQMAKTA